MFDSLINVVKNANSEEDNLRALKWAYDTQIEELRRDSERVKEVLEDWIQFLKQKLSEQDFTI